MGRIRRPLSPDVSKKLRALGERICLARMRRGISASLMAERLGISRTTLGRLEDGEPALAIGTYLKALRVLGLDDDIDAVALSDPIGRSLLDSQAHIRRQKQEE
jgi:transcriptional regulator with XRE-family HTH domain